MRVPVIWDDEGGAVTAGTARLWSARRRWTCRGRPLDVRVVAGEALELPAAEASGEEPVESALARLLAACAGRGALLALLNPAAALGRERIAFAAGCRLLGIAGDDDLACWDALLASGQPCYGLRGTPVADLARETAPALLSALAYGLFTCEEGLAATALAEDRAGVELAVERPATFSVIARGGFAVHAERGSRLAWRDSGAEGVVRVEAQADDGGRLWTQPRLVAPRREAAHA